MPLDRCPKPLSTGLYCSSNVFIKPHQAPQVEVRNKSNVARLQKASDRPNCGRPCVFTGVLSLHGGEPMHAAAVVCRFTVCRASSCTCSVCLTGKRESVRVKSHVIFSTFSSFHVVFVVFCRPCTAPAILAPTTASSPHAFFHPPFFPSSSEAFKNMPLSLLINGSQHRCKVATA